MLIGLSGIFGAGKDAAALILEKHYGFQRFSFADCLKRELEVALRAALIPNGLPEKGREAFLTCLALGYLNPFAKPTPPEMRILMQQWGTEFRRAQDENYWVNKLRRSWEAVGRPDAAVPDTRFYNEAHWVRSENGLIFLINSGDRVAHNYDHRQLAHESERFALEQLANPTLVNYIVDNTMDDPTLGWLTSEIVDTYEMAAHGLAA
jgi:hypothetical protein